MRLLAAYSLAILNFSLNFMFAGKTSSQRLRECQIYAGNRHTKIGGFQLFTFILPRESPVCLHYILCHCRRVCILCPPLAWTPLWVSMLLSNSRVPIVRQQRWIISSDKRHSMHTSGRIHTRAANDPSVSAITEKALALSHLRHYGKQAPKHLLRLSIVS